MSSKKRVLLLHDLCSVGKAALVNMLPILGVMQIEACPLPTMLLSTHTGGYGRPAVQKTALQYVRDCVEHYKREKVMFSAIFLGYLGNNDMIEAAQYVISALPGIPVIFDPIMGDGGDYYSNFSDKYGKNLRRLVPDTDIIIPNMTESCLLLEWQYQEAFSEKQLKNMCEQLGEQGGKTIIITSVKTTEGKQGVVIWENGTFTMKNFVFSPKQYHGTGDIFDAVFLGSYLQGKSLENCVEKAHHFVYQCVKYSEKYNDEKREGLRFEQALPMLFEN